MQTWYLTKIFIYISYIFHLTQAQDTGRDRARASSERRRAARPGNRRRPRSAPWLAGRHRCVHPSWLRPHRRRGWLRRLLLPLPRLPLRRVGPHQEGTGTQELGGSHLQNHRRRVPQSRLKVYCFILLYGNSCCVKVIVNKL